MEIVCVWVVGVTGGVDPVPDLDAGLVVVDVRGPRLRVVGETLLFLRPWGAGLLQTLPLELVAGSF